MFFDNIEAKRLFATILDVPPPERPARLAGVIDSPGDRRFALRAVDWLHNLVATGGKIAIVGEELIFRSIFAVKLETLEDILILHEILVAGDYNIYPRRPAVLLDIGMNVGMSALYFAAKPNIVKVVGFEPVQGTYARACRNLDRNPELTLKIQAENFGVGGTARTQEIDVSGERPGVAGIYGYRGFSDQERHNLSKETIRIVAAGELLRTVKSQTDPGLDLIAKIDCEGAEYEIVDCLCQSGDIGLLSAILLEWHRVDDRGAQPAELVKWLQDAGFNTVLKDPFSGNAGMLYAFGTGVTERGTR